MCERGEIHSFELHANRDTVWCSVLSNRLLLRLITLLRYGRNVISILLLQTQQSRFSGFELFPHFPRNLKDIDFLSQDSKHFSEAFVSLSTLTRSCQRRRKLYGQLPLDRRRSIGRDGFLVRLFPP